MMFQESLLRLIKKLPESTAALLVGHDGICVDAAVSSQKQLDVLAVSLESAYLMNQVQKSSSVLQMGIFEQMILKTKENILLLHKIDSYYFLAIAFPSHAWLGKACFFTLETAEELKKVLHHA